MKICLSCLSPLPDAGWHCAHCGRQPEQYGTIPSFAPRMTGVKAGYDPSWYEELVRLEADNFWFAARNRLIAFLARRYAPSCAKYMEIGCGTGFVLHMLRKSFPEWDMTATETQVDGLTFAQQRVPGDLLFLQMDACAIPFREEFDVIGAFDVLEHISDDEAAMAQIHMALKNGGILLASVPQHRFLWSKYDAAACHHRRYGAKEFERTLQKIGFIIMDSSSFNALLLPMMLLSRCLKNLQQLENIDVLAELRLSSWLNKLLAAVLHMEFRLIQLGVRFPFGGSKIVVARKSAEIR